MKIRERIITRTVKSYKVEVIGINENSEVETRTFEIPLIEEKKIGAYLAEICPADFAPAKVKKFEIVEQLYGMPESVFMAHAEKLPPRGVNESDNGEG